MPRVRLVSEALWRDANYPFEDAALLVTVWCLAEPAFDLQAKCFCKFTFVPHETGASSKSGKVASVYRNGGASAVVETRNTGWPHRGESPWGAVLGYSIPPISFPRRGCRTQNA